MAIHTTLYDLIAAFSAEVRPDEEDVLTATIVHLVNTHRVTCTGNLKGYQLVCDGRERAAWSREREDELFSQGIARQPAMANHD
jgi:hypothetical protein